MKVTFCRVYFLYVRPLQSRQSTVCLLSQNLGVAMISRIEILIFIHIKSIIIKTEKKKNKN